MPGSKPYFGELSILSAAPRAASVEAVTRCRLLVLEPDAVSSLMREFPELRQVLEERAALYDADNEARIPLDFADELLPAEVQARSVVPAPESAEPLSEEGDTEWGEAFQKHARPKLRVPFVQQIDEMDCGAAALAMVCRAFGRKVPLALVRRLLQTAHDGTSLMALCTAAESLGLEARAVKVSRARLDELPLPAILHWEGNHWLVLERVGKSRVTVVDPDTGRRSIERAELLEKWSGYAALYARTPKLDEAPEERGLTLAWLVPFLLPHRALFAKLLGLALVAGVLALVLPLFMQVVVDRIAGRRYGRYSSRQIDAIEGMEAVKASGAEETLRERMLAEFESLAKKQFRGGASASRRTWASRSRTRASRGGTSLRWRTRPSSGCVPPTSGGAAPGGSSAVVARATDHRAQQEKGRGERACSTTVRAGKRPRQPVSGERTSPARRARRRRRGAERTWPAAPARRCTRSGSEATRPCGSCGRGRPIRQAPPRR